MSDIPCSETIRSPVLLAIDLATARKLYHDKLGLQIERENENAIVFRCGNSTRLDMTKSTVGTAGQQTQAAWQVSEIRTEMAELRARGVKVEDFDTRANDRSPGGRAGAGLAELLARCSTSPLRSKSVKGRYSGTGGNTGV